MTPLRLRMIEDMTLAGLANWHPGRLYPGGPPLGRPLSALAGPVERGRGARLSARPTERGVALGTFKTHQGGIQFLYRRTLERDWPLFWKKLYLPAPAETPARRPLSDAQDPRSAGPRKETRSTRRALTVMYACGLRIGEATTLEVTTVDGANRILRIIGKGDKERRVPLPQPVLDDLRSLWRNTPQPALALPQSWSGSNRSPQKLCAAPSGPPPRLPAPATGSHRMRSGTAMRPGFSKSGVDTRVVQILLGHVNIATTAVYTHLTEPTRDLAQKRSRQADGRPLTPAIGRDRDRGGLPPLRG